ncbi:MAG: glycoside hydrolase family 5 protein [Holosporales bacterium]|nr:glycoside hydrolase family 5 protein [Holosporales bacterium]
MAFGRAGNGIKMRKILEYVFTIMGIVLISCSCNRDIQKRNAQEIDSKQKQNKMAFWNVPKKGANMFCSRILREDIRAAKTYGIEFVRLCVDKFPSKSRDFLLGNADHYDHLEPVDLDFLLNVLYLFEQENMPVVLTMLSLPGSRWKQNNNDKDDLRIWKDAKFQQQAAHFWSDLAAFLSKNKIIVGYNILNEPHPERLFDTKNCHIDQINQTEVQKLLFDFNKLIVENIRRVDANTPIIIESSSYADPNTFKHLRPIPDSRTIYSFHMYEPYSYTNHKLNKDRLPYPGKFDGKNWNRANLKDYMKAVENFRQSHNIPSNRILVGEFGCYRKQKGLPQYFEDLISIFNEHGWHWAFYAFRENTWDGMNYELGDRPLPWAYWKAQERGEEFALTHKATFPQFVVLKNALCQARLRVGFLRDASKLLSGFKQVSHEIPDWATQ